MTKVHIADCISNLHQGEFVSLARTEKKWLQVASEWCISDIDPSLNLNNNTAICGHKSKRTKLAMLFGWDVVIIPCQSHPTIKQQFEKMWIAGFICQKTLGRKLAKANNNNIEEAEAEKEGKKNLHLPCTSTVGRTIPTSAIEFSISLLCALGVSYVF